VSGATLTVKPSRVPFPALPPSYCAPGHLALTRGKPPRQSPPVVRRTCTPLLPQATCRLPCPSRARAICDTGDSTHALVDEISPPARVGADSDRTMADRDDPSPALPSSALAELAAGRGGAEIVAQRAGIFSGIPDPWKRLDGEGSAAAARLVQACIDVRVGVCERDAHATMNAPGRCLSVFLCTPAQAEAAAATACCGTTQGREFRVFTRAYEAAATAAGSAGPGAAGGEGVTVELLEFAWDGSTGQATVHTVPIAAVSALMEGVGRLAFDDM